MLRRNVALSLVLLLAVAAVANDKKEGPRFVLALADGSSASGVLDEIGDRWSIGVGGRRIAGEEVLSLRREGATLPPAPVNEQVIFADGDRLPGAVLELSGERLRFKASLGADREMSLPLSALSVIWVVPPEGADNPEKLRRRLAAARRNRDVVLLRNGDTLEGALTALERGGDLQIEVAGKPQLVKFDKVAVIAFNSELMTPAGARVPFARMALLNGCRLALASIRADSSKIVGKTLFGSDVEVALDQLVVLDLNLGRAVYLSDLKPQSYETRSYLGGTLRWPYVADGSVFEGDLHIGGSTFDKGLGMHGGSSLTFDLGGAYRRFEAIVGLNDRTGREGLATVKALVDGKEQDIGWNGELTWPAGPRPVRFNVTGARRLTLVAEFGEWGDVQACVDWANARLVK